MFFFSRHKEPPTLFIGTDIHCHILPGIDDGSPDVDTSVELVERMRSWGLKRIWASPHVTQDTFENTPETMDAALAELNAALKQRDVTDIEIDHSAEYRMDDYFISQFENGVLIPYPGTRYLLVENSFIQEPWNIEQLIWDLKVKRFKPILAHPERYFYYHRHLDRYKKLHMSGTLFQVNILSLAGHYGKHEKEIAEYLIEHDLVDFLGTDLHNHRHADSIEAYLKSKSYRHMRDALEDRIRNPHL